MERGSFNNNEERQQELEKTPSSFEDNMKAIESPGPKGPEWLLKVQSRFYSLVAAGALTLSFLSGCSRAENNQEGYQPEAPKAQEVQKTDESGFTDDARKVIQERQKLQMQRIKAMKGYNDNMKNVSPEQIGAAEKTIEEMREPLIPQDRPENNPGGVQRPKPGIQPGPSGRVIDPEDL